ncbi:hypothetical protein MNBD_ALPHA11-452 [hydrothermal vent metagenome]|uniref:Uncharacterized protein n=1 Tax=hydrothermal vent metagenome TaxID=652676 RepID=A0A3B0UH90_9ZZZZ
MGLSSGEFWQNLGQGKNMSQKNPLALKIYFYRKGKSVQMM